MAFAAPLIAAVSAPGAIAAAAGVSALGSIYAGYSQNQQAKAVAANADANAKNVRLQGAANEDSQRRENRLRMGYARAAAVESGFDASSGSLLNMQIKSAQEMELDTLTERYSNELSALSLNNEATTARNQGRAALISGGLNAAGTLFQGAVGYGRASKLPTFEGYGGRY